MAKPLATLLFALGLLAAAPQETMPVNSKCPVNGAGIDNKYLVSVQGKTIAFCSRLCCNKFVAHMEVYLPTIPGFEPKKKEGQKSEDKKGDGKAITTGPCDCKKIVKGYYCPECKRDLAAGDLQGSVCRKCGTKPALVDYCVKLTAPTLHAGEVFARAEEDRARIDYECETCRAVGEVESETKHKAACKAPPGVALRKVCTKSGTAPHDAAPGPDDVSISALPPRGDVRRSEIVTRHYRIYLEKYDPTEVADLAEAAYAAWTDFFGRAPLLPDRDPSALLLLKAYATREAYVDGGRQDKTPAPAGQPNMGIYWTGTRIAHFYAPDGVGALRFMLLHEGTHQFHFQAMTGNAGAGPAWYAEGLGYWFGDSLWDPKAKTLKLGGRFKPAPLAAPARTLKAITSDPAVAVSFLVHRYPLQFRRLAAALDKHRDENEAWREGFGFEEAPAEFAEEYSAWRASGAEGGFPGWVALTGSRAIPAAVRVSTWALGQAAPASLLKLKEAVSQAEALQKDVGAVYVAGLGAVLKDLKNLPAPLAPQVAFAAAALVEACPAPTPAPKKAGLGLGGKEQGP